jgi:hypothetical protein
VIDDLLQAWTKGSWMPIHIFAYSRGCVEAGMLAKKLLSKEGTDAFITKRDAYIAKHKNDPHDMNHRAGMMNSEIGIQYIGLDDPILRKFGGSFAPIVIPKNVVAVWRGIRGIQPFSLEHPTNIVGLTADITIERGGKTKRRDQPFPGLDHRKMGYDDTVFKAMKADAARYGVIWSML